MDLINTEIIVLSIQVFLVPLVIYNLRTFKKQIAIDNKELINKRTTEISADLRDLRTELTYKHDIWVIDNRSIKRRISNIETFLQTQGFICPSGKDETDGFI